MVLIKTICRCVATWHNSDLVLLAWLDYHMGGEMRFTQPLFGCTEARIAIWMNRRCSNEHRPTFLNKWPKVFVLYLHGGIFEWMNTFTFGIPHGNILRKVDFWCVLYKPNDKFIIHVCIKIESSRLSSESVRSRSYLSLSRYRIKLTSIVISNIAFRKHCR